jgi:chromatin assembly factor 1 subunit A
MSQGKTDSVDLTKDEDSSKSKKMKQMRLPFAKIDKNVALAKMEAEVQKKAEELSKKRKLSVSSTEEEATIMDAAEGTPNATGIVKVGSSKKKARQSSSPRKRSISQENTTIKKLAKKDDADDIEIIEVKKVEVSSPNEPPMMTDSLIKTPESKAKKINKPRSKAKKATPESKATKAVGGTLMKSPEPVAKAMDALIKTPEPVSKLKDSTLKTPDPTPGSSEKVKILTPKQLARKAMFDKQREEKERQKEDARLAREAEKTKRDAEKKEMEAQKKAEIQEREKERLKKKKQKDEMEAQKKAEFHEREKERLQKKKQKDEQKETERKEREEAAKKKQEEKEEKERAEKAKSEKSKLSFSKFFVKGQKEAETKAVPKPVCNNGLNQFRIKVNMKLAPLVRVNDRDSKKSLLDCSLNTDVVKEAGLYLSGLKRDQYKAGRQGKTWPYSVKKADDDDDDIEIIEEDEEDLIGDEIQDEQDKASPKAIGRVFTKAKLLQFHDNQRPAYFGTWNKKTSKVSPRRPFGMDSEIFDYEYDSDDDWEEEEQGESLSDEEKDKEEDEVEEQNDKDDEDDDGFFVGHGVLDKDELKAAEDEEDAFDEELEIKKQKLKAQQFEEEYKKKKPIKLKPRVFGCFWNDIIKEEKDNELRIAYDQLIKILTPFKAVVLTTNRDEPIQTSVSKPGQDQEQGDSPNR